MKNLALMLIWGFIAGILDVSVLSGPKQFAIVILPRFLIAIAERNGKM